MFNIFNLRKKNFRGQPELNRWPLDLQSNALPLSYTPNRWCCIILPPEINFIPWFHAHNSQIGDKENGQKLPFPWQIYAETSRFSKIRSEHVAICLQTPNRKRM